VSKSHPEQWTINEVAERPDRSLVTALREFDTTQIADCGGPVAVVGPPLRHLAGGPQLCGPAVTVWTKPGDILYVLKATDLIGDGDVLVIDGGGRLDAAVIGDIAGQALADLGCDGLVVDGAVRDLDGLDAAGLATFAVGAHPATGSNQGPGAINVVVQCGGVTVRPGDVVRGDASGLVVVPKEHLGPVLAMTKAVADRETGWRQAIARGASLPTAAGIDDLISKLAADRGTVLACGAGNDPHRRHRRSQPKDVIWIGRHDNRAAMHGRHSNRMGIDDVLGIRADAMKDRPHAASEIEVRRDDADRGPCGTGIAMPRQR